MKLIAALGNPGDKYSNTRHNAGFMIIDKLAQKWGFEFMQENKFKSLICKTFYNNEPIFIIKPQTFMNLSGEAVGAVMHFYKIELPDLLVVYDDISLSLGKMRFRANGSDGGHNGIKSIISHVNSDKFARLKFGVGPQPANVPSEVFVLSDFPKDDKQILEDTVQKATEAIECYFSNGMEKAQNMFN